MNSNPLISIIVPLYNVEKYITSCLESLINQTYKNIEIIAVNDGSTDQTGVNIKKYIKKDTRIIYFEKENGGVSETRNLGLKMAKGDYITFVDGDDWISLNFIEEAFQLIRKHNLDLILGGTQKVYQNKYVSCNIDREILIYEDQIDLFISKVLSNGKVLDLNNCFTSGPVCKLFTKEALSQIEFNKDLVIGEDSVFNLKILNKIKRAGVVPNIWYYYRINHNSATQSFNPLITEQTEKLMTVLENMYSDHLEYRPYLVERGIQQFEAMLFLYPLNKRGKLSLRQQIKYIKQCLDKDIWNKLFVKNIHKIPGSTFDRLLLYACVHNMPVFIVLLMRSKLIIKQMLRKG